LEDTLSTISPASRLYATNQFGPTQAMPRSIRPCQPVTSIGFVHTGVGTLASSSNAQRLRSSMRMQSTKAGSKMVLSQGSFGGDGRIAVSGDNCEIPRSSQATEGKTCLDVAAPALKTYRRRPPSITVVPFRIHPLHLDTHKPKPSETCQRLSMFIILLSLPTPPQ
jgi:hypothetical protein